MLVAWRQRLTWMWGCSCRCPALALCPVWHLWSGQHSDSPSCTHLFTRMNKAFWYHHSQHADPSPPMETGSCHNGLLFTCVCIYYFSLNYYLQNLALKLCTSAIKIVSFYGVFYSFLPQYLDLQLYLDLQICFSKREVSLHVSLRGYGESLVGLNHNV